ncbi:hypothetical protein ES705_36993 [subsurface metagenome]
MLLAEVVGSKERANTLRPESLWRVRPLFFLVEVFAPPEVDRLTKKEEVKAMPPEFAIAVPRTEEMTSTAIGVGTGVVTGLAQGVVAKFAPQMGALAPVLTWGSLLITPVLGVAGALFTTGMISDACKGVAIGSCGVLGFSLPGLLPELGLARRPGGGQLTAEQRAALAAAARVKQLPPGAQYAPQRQQAAVSVGLGYE